MKILAYFFFFLMGPDVLTSGSPKLKQPNNLPSRYKEEQNKTKKLQ